MPWRVMVGDIGIPTALAAAVACSWAAVAWIAGLDANAIAIAISAVGLAMLYVRARYDKWKQQSTQEWDVINKDSLSAQLEAERARREKADAESAANQIKMRATLHEIVNQANRNGLEAEDLRGQLRLTTQQLMDTNRELREANALNVELTERIAQLQAGVEKMPRLTGAAVGAVVQRALSDSRADMASYRPPDPPAPPMPDPIPGSPSP